MAAGVTVRPGEIGAFRSFLGMKSSRLLVQLLWPTMLVLQLHR